MPRPSWKGYLKLSLVSCGVALYNASSSSERVSFNTLNRKTGNRLKQSLVDSVSGEPVDTADRVKGYQVAKGQYVMVEDSDLEALRIESTKTLEIETFVPAAEIDEIYLDSPYYLAPDGKMAEEAFAVIREAMAKKKVAGIGRVVLARRERLLMLQPRGPGMLATTLRYPYEVRQDAEYFEGIGERKLAPAMLDIAQEIIGRMSGSFEPTSFADRYEEAVIAMLQAKQAGQSFAVPETAEPGNVVDIMEALKRSLQAGADRRPRAPSKKPAEARRRNRRASRGAQDRGAQGGALRPEAGLPLAPLGQTLFLVGRLQGLTRRRLDRLVRAQGGRLAPRPGARVTMIAFGHSAAGQALDDGRVQLPAGLPATAALISENVLRRELGLLEPPTEVERSLGRAEVERLAGLTPNLLSCLMLFDVLEPVDERFAYRDLVAAREAARLLKRGVALGDVLEASISLRAARRPSRRGAAHRGSVGRAGARDRGPARRALGPAHHAPADAPGAEGTQPRRSSGRGRRGRRRRRPRHGREPLHHGDARRHRRSGAALQSRQRVPGAGPRRPRPRWRGRSRWRAIRRSPRPGTTSPRRPRTSSRPISPSPSTAAPCRPSPAMPTPTSTWRCCSPSSTAAARRSPPGNASSSSNRRRSRPARRTRRSRSAA